MGLALVRPGASDGQPSHESHFVLLDVGKRFTCRRLGDSGFIEQLGHKLDSLFIFVFLSERAPNLTGHFGARDAVQATFS